MKLISGSPRENVMVTLGTGALVLLVPLAFYAANVNDEFSPVLYLTSATALGGALAMFMAYVNVVTARRNGADSILQARLTRAAAAAPVVSARVLPGLSPSDAGDEVRLDLTVEVENHGTTPSVITPSAPSMGWLRDQGAMALPPRREPSGQNPVHVRLLPLTVRIPKARIGLVAEKHGVNWPVTVPLTVQDVARTVTDVYHLTFELRPQRVAGAEWTWTLEEDQGYAVRVSRTPEQIETEQPTVPRPPSRTIPAALPGKPPSPRLPVPANSRRP